MGDAQQFRSDQLGHYGSIQRYWYGFPDYGKGDRECLADIRSLGYLLNKNDQKAWKLDWGKNGIQWGARPPLTAAPPFFPWTFYGMDGFSQASIPNSVLFNLSQLDGGGM